MIALLDSKNLNAQLGACTALEQFRGAAAPAVSKLQVKLKADDHWLRVRAASALAAIGTPAMAALPDFLAIIGRDFAPTDPLGMEQRFISAVIFNQLLTYTKTLEGVDREKLRNAIAQGLRNQDGYARCEISKVFRNLSYEVLQPLLPSI